MKEFNAMKRTKLAAFIDVMFISVALGGLVWCGVLALRLVGVL